MYALKRDRICAAFNLESYPLHGGRSSTAERLTVDQEVAGSKPVGHPIIT